MLTTKRCVLRTFQKEHIPDVHKLYVNEQVRKYLGGIRSDKEINNLLLETINSKIGFHWVVLERYTEHFIGLVSITPHHDNDNLEISYQFSPQWWGYGYATEVIQFIIHYAFHELNMTRLIAETQTANIASCKLLEKVGMKLENKVTRFGTEQAIYSIIF